MSFSLSYYFAFWFPISPLCSTSLICSFPILLFCSTVKWLAQDRTWRHKKPLSQWSGMWIPQAQLSWKCHFLVLESLNRSDVAVSLALSSLLKWPSFNKPCLHRWRSKGEGRQGELQPLQTNIWWGLGSPMFWCYRIARIVHKTVLAE